MREVKFIIDDTNRSQNLIVKEIIALLLSANIEAHWSFFAEGQSRHERYAILYDKFIKLHEKYETVKSNFIETCVKYEKMKEALGIKDE